MIDKLINLTVKIVNLLFIPPGLNSKIKREQEEERKIILFHWNLQISWFNFVGILLALLVVFGILLRENFSLVFSIFAIILTLGALVFNLYRIKKDLIFLVNAIRKRPTAINEKYHFKNVNPDIKTLKETYKSLGMFALVFLTLIFIPLLFLAIYYTILDK